MNQLISILIIILLFGVLNTALTGVQKIWHHKDNAKLSEIKEDLSNQLIIINDQNNDLTLVENEVKHNDTTLESYSSYIKNVEQRYPNGVPSNIYNNYLEVLKKHNVLVQANNLLINQHELKYSRYNENIKDYNEKVDAANIIAKKVSSTWYIIPMPRGGKSRVSSK